MPKAIKLATNVVAQAKRRYDAGASIPEICASLRVSRTWFLEYRRTHGWTLRPKIGRPPAGKPAAPRPAKRKRAKPPRRALIARLEDAIEREFARAETALQLGSPQNIEASARALASLIKSLAELKRLRRNDGAKDSNDGATAIDEPPRELAELRAELARRLDRLRDRRRTE